MMRRTIKTTDVALHSLTLPAGQVCSITIESAGFGRFIVEVYTDGAAPAYLTTDGSLPTVAGANTLLVPPHASVNQFTLIPGASGRSTVQLISPGTPTLSITRVRQVNPS